MSNPQLPSRAEATANPYETPNEDRARGRALAYHRNTEHSLERYARGPETLDWDAQPAPFRHFEGAPTYGLPRVADVREEDFPGLRTTLGAPDQPKAVPHSLSALGVLLGLAFGISAWKSSGPDRWAVRANPSSGNLHPVEAYVLIHGVDGVASGVYHYRPDEHTLEQRAAWETPGPWKRPRVWVALSCVMWREAWKYGERAFRYCQLDVGHAIGAVRYAGGVLGWRVRQQTQIGSETLARALGLTRLTDFAGGRRADTEREEPELLLELESGASQQPVLPAELHALTTGALFLGRASTIDNHPMYTWPSIEEVAQATRAADGNLTAPVESPDVSSLNDRLGAFSVEQLLGRRSAQRFDKGAVLEQDALARILTGLSGCNVWSSVGRPEAPSVDLVLFAHRVAGLPSGVYLYPRVSDPRGALRSWLIDTEQLAETHQVDGKIELIEIARIAPTELARLARTLHCHQDIAATCCVAFGMVVHLNHALEKHAAAYREVHREAGIVGQELYLRAEVEGMRGTGVGCFFDDAVRRVVGLEASPFVPIYHFTIGKPIEDARIDSSIRDTQLEPSRAQP